MSVMLPATSELVRRNVLSRRATNGASSCFGAEGRWFAAIAESGSAFSHVTRKTSHSTPPVRISLPLAMNRLVLSQR